MDNGARIEVSRIADKSKMLVLISHIAAFWKIPPAKESQMFSGGTNILLSNGARLEVREFTGVVDFLISEQTDDSVASRYVAGEDPDRDKAYNLFKELNGRVVQTEAEVAAQAADGDVAQTAEPQAIQPAVF